MKVDRADFDALHAARLGLLDEEAAAYGIGVTLPGSGVTPPGFGVTADDAPPLEIESLPLVATEGGDTGGGVAEMEVAGDGADGEVMVGEEPTAVDLSSDHLKTLTVCEPSFVYIYMHLSICLQVKKSMAIFTSGYPSTWLCSILYIYTYLSINTYIYKYLSI